MPEGLHEHADPRPAWRQAIPSPAAKKLESITSRLVSKKIAQDSAPDVPKLAQVPLQSWSVEGPDPGAVQRSQNSSGQEMPQPPLLLVEAEAPGAGELQGDLPQRSESTPSPTTRAAFDGARGQLQKVLAREPSWSFLLPALATCATCGATCSHCAEVRAETAPDSAGSPPPSPPGRAQGGAEAPAVDPAAGPSRGAWRGGTGGPARSSSSYHREAIRAKLAMLAAGESSIKCPSPPNVLKDTHDCSCYRARSDEHQHLMTEDSPTARRCGRRQPSSSHCGQPSKITGTSSHGP
jgi:hypothetical protein